MKSVDLKTGKIDNLPSMIIGGTSLSAELIKNSIYVFGGTGGNRVVRLDVENMKQKLSNR